MRYISEKVLTPNGLFRSKDGEPLGPADDVVLRPSDLLGTVKRSLERRRGGGAASRHSSSSSGVRRSGSRCQCKHHQQRQLRQLKQRQEEQRRQLKRQLAESGAYRRHLEAIDRHTSKWKSRCPLSLFGVRRCCGKSKCHHHPWWRWVLHGPLLTFLPLAKELPLSRYIIEANC